MQPREEGVSGSDNGKSRQTDRAPEMCAYEMLVSWRRINEDDSNALKKYSRAAGDLSQVKKRAAMVGEGIFREHVSR